MKFKPKARGTSTYVTMMSTANLFLTALIGMVLLGILHSVHESVPTVDYWTAVLALAIVRGIYQFVIVDWRKIAEEDLDASDGGARPFGK